MFFNGSRSQNILNNLEIQNFKSLKVALNGKLICLGSQIISSLSIRLILI